MQAENSNNEKNIYILNNKILKSRLCVWVTLNISAKNNTPANDNKMPIILKESSRDFNKINIPRVRNTKEIQVTIFV